MNNRNDKADPQIERLFDHAVSPGAFAMMFDTYCNATVLGVQQWRWHWTTLNDQSTLQPVDG